MVRYIAVIAELVTFLFVFFIFGQAFIPVNDTLANQDPNPNAGINTSEHVTTSYDVIFKWMPLIAMAGFVLLAVLWYWKLTQTRGGF